MKTTEQAAQDVRKIAQYLAEASHQFDRWVDPANVDRYSIDEARRLAHRALYEIDRYEARREHDEGPIA